MDLNSSFDEATKEELRSIKDDDKEIKERFYKMCIRDSKVQRADIMAQNPATREDKLAKLYVVQMCIRDRTRMLRRAYISAISRR